MPWREPVHLYVISYVARLHAGADPAARKMGLQHLRTVFGDSVLAVPGFTGALWIFHLAIAAIWAGDLDRAAELTRQSESQPHPPHWMEWVLRLAARTGRRNSRGDRASAASTWMRRSPGSLTICPSTGPTFSPITRESRLSSTTTQPPGDHWTRPASSIASSARCPTSRG